LQLHLRHGPKESNDTGHTTFCIGFNDIEARDNKFAVLVNSPMIAVETVLGVNTTGSRIYGAWQPRMDFVNVRLESIDAGDINRGIHEVDFGG
jgi:hypothetical protein